MLLHLFSSRTRVKLLSIFLLNQGQDYFIRELTRLTSEQINSVRRELDNLESIDILSSHMKNNKKFYSLNPKFVILTELTAIFNKLSDDRFELLQGISQCGDIDVLAISDTLNSAKTDGPCNIVIVGDITGKDKKTLDKFLEGLEKKYDREIRYMVLAIEDFSFRHKCHDKFLTEFFLAHPLVLIDKLKYSW